MQARATPQSAVSSAVGSAIRPLGSGLSSAGPGSVVSFTPGDRQADLSPAMANLTDASPTLTLLPSLSQTGPGGQVRKLGTRVAGATPAVCCWRLSSGAMLRAQPLTGLRLPTSPPLPRSPPPHPTPLACPHHAQGVTSGDGSTPSLLDARAASPSAVYAPLYAATPFRGALAALPIDAALAAPLVDNSPFNLAVSARRDGGPPAPHTAAGPGGRGEQGQRSR